MKRYLSILILALTKMIAVPSYSDEDDVTISNETLGNSYLTTIDIDVTEELALQDDLLIDYDYSKIRNRYID